MLIVSVRGRNVTICIQFYFVNSKTNGHFFHTMWTHLHASHALVFQSPPMLDIINMPMHSTAFSPSPFVSLWRSIRGSDLAGTPCINNCMNITMLSVLFCVTLSCGGTEMLCLRCEFAAFMIRYWGNRSKHCEGVHMASIIITRDSPPCAVFPCLVAGNLSGIHGNTTEFGASN